MEIRRPPKPDSTTSIYDRILTLLCRNDCNLSGHFDHWARAILRNLEGARCSRRADRKSACSHQYKHDSAELPDVSDSGGVFHRGAQPESSSSEDPGLRNRHSHVCASNG